MITIAITLWSKVRGITGTPTGNGTMNFSTAAASPNNSTALLALLEDI